MHSHECSVAHSGRARGIGRVVFVGAGPGAADLLALRALRYLECADCVLHDALVSDDVLACIPTHVVRVNVGKRAGAGGTGQERVHQLLVSHARRGELVVRLKGGDPTVFARLAEEIDALRAAGINYEIVPGITAASACAAVLGIPLTDRARASGVRLETGAQAVGAGTDGAPPAHTRVLYMAGRALAAFARRALEQGTATSTPVAIVSSGTRATQRVRFTTLGALESSVGEDDVSSPTLAIMGDVVNHAH